MTTLGRHPDALAVKLTLGDGAHLVASTVNGWAGPVTLHYGPKTGDPVISDVGTVDGDEVSWTLTEAEVTARAEHDWARLEDNGVTLAAGPVMTWLGGLGSTTTQTIASLTAGPPGPTAVSTDADNVAGLGSDGLIYVSPADAGGFSDAAVAAFVADEDSDTYASITALQPDLSGYVETTDARLSDARTPTTHATSHASGGSDPVTPASIGAATPAQVSSGDTATLAAAQLHAQGLVDALTAASPATLDTLAEIAAALGEDSNFAATMTAALAARVRHDAAQSLTVSEQAQARSNIGAAPALGPDDNYVTDAEKAALHSHANKAALDNVSGVNTGDQTLPTWTTIAGKPTFVAEGATAADARTAIGAGTSSFSGDYDDLTDKPTLGDAAAKNTGTTAGTLAAGDDSRITGAAQKSANLSDLANAGTARTNLGLGTAATTAASAYATAAQGALADTALQVATAQPINAQTGTTYTLVASDAGKIVTLTNAAAITLNAPGSVFSAGQRVDVIVLGAGMATVVGTSGATVNGTPTLVSRAQYSAFTVVWTSATSAVVVGDLAAA